MLSSLKLEIKNEKLNWILKCSRSVRHQVTFKNAANFFPQELHANTLYKFMTDIEEVYKGARELEKASS
jgi:hypothetical protein